MSYDTPTVPRHAAYAAAMGSTTAPDKISGKRLSRIRCGSDFDFGRRHWGRLSRSWKRFRRTRWRLTAPPLETTRSA